MSEVESKKAKGKSKSETRCSRLPLPFYFFLFTFSLLLGSAAVSPAATQVYAKVDTETAVYAGEDFAYSIVVEGGGQPSKIDLSSLAPFNPRSIDNGARTNITINGRAMSSYARSYAIAAGKAGAMHLPPVTVVVDGQTYTTNAVDVTVSQPGTTDRMSLELSISEKQCYVGQPLVMTVKWTITARVQQGTFDVPVFQSDDFYIEDLSGSANAVAKEQTAIHGVPVTVTEERQLVGGVEGAILSFRKVLIPKRSGRIRLDPLRISANLAVGRERTDDFFNPYRIKFQRVSAQSNPVELEVQPLPEAGKPPQFYGLIGPYSISASATPTKVNVGDPITLTIRIGGNPYLKPVQWPALEQVPELAANFKIPAEKASPVLEAGGKVFTQTIRANSDKVTQIPAIPLAYFDPDPTRSGAAGRGAYAVAKTEPIKLEVAPSKVLTNVDVQGTASTPVNREVEAIRKGLSANYYGPDVLENQSFSILSVLANPVCATLWSIPLLALIVSSAVKLAGRTSPESLARKRRRRAAGAALAQLKQVSSAEPGQRHELLLCAMKGYIGDRFDKVAASLTADDCHRILTDSTGDAVAAAKCKELIDACEAARYAPLQAKVGPDQVQTAVELIQAVEKQGRRSEGKKVRTSEGRKFFPSGLLTFLLLWALCLVLGPAAKAAPALPGERLHDLLQDANAAFQAANAANNSDVAKPLYDQAILLYEKIINQGGIQNAKLYYNLANAYLLKEDLGRAILNYRRAEKLDRSDLHIQKNLTFARSQRADRVETSAQRRVWETLFFWHYDFSGRTKFLLATIAWAALCLGLTALVWTRGSGDFGFRISDFGLKKTNSPNPQSAIRNPQWPLWAALLSAVLLAAFLTSLAVQTRREAATRPGVITAVEVVARQGDGPNYPPSFKDPLHAGMEFDLLEHRPGWFHLRLSDGSEAWIPDDTAGLV
jgi:tetratricopeptide (TPR) repeat protein